MTKEEAKELLPIITAFAEGKAIEVKGSYGEWVEVISPDFGNGPKTIVSSQLQNIVHSRMQRNV